LTNTFGLCHFEANNKGRLMMPNLQKGLEIVLKTLSDHREDDKYPLGQLRQVEIRYEIKNCFNRDLSRERVRQIVNSLVRKGLVKKNIIYKYDTRVQRMGDVKTFSLIN